MPSPFLFPLFVMHGACVPFVILRLTGTKIKRRLKKYSYSLKKKKKLLFSYNIQMDGNFGRLLQF